MLFCWTGFTINTVLCFCTISRESLWFLSYDFVNETITFSFKKSNFGKSWRIRDSNFLSYDQVRFLCYQRCRLILRNCLLKKFSPFLITFRPKNNEDCPTLMSFPIYIARLNIFMCTTCVKSMWRRVGTESFAASHMLIKKLLHGQWQSDKNTLYSMFTVKKKFLGRVSAAARC